MTVEEYREDRVAELGEFLGTVIAGIYQGIRDGEADNDGVPLTTTVVERRFWVDVHQAVVEVVLRVETPIASHEEVHAAYAAQGRA